MSDFNLLVHGRLADDSQGSLAISEGKFVAIGANIAGTAREEIDYGDARLLPGWIDAHVHFNEPGRADWEGIATGSRALAAGGGTMFFDMPLNSDPPVLSRRDFENKREIGERKSCLDFALWGGLTPDSLDHMEDMADAGAIGFKAFMCPSGIDEFQAANPSTLRRGMAIAARVGLPVAVHAEDPDVVSAHQRTHPPASRDMRAWLDSRPIEAELSAIRIATNLAGETGCALHIVHVTCPEGIAMVHDAKQRGVDVTVETCPHYLLLDTNAACRIGPPAKCAPPIRSAATVAGLWRELEAGRIDTIGSDHSPSPPDLKQGDDVFAMWGGIAGIQHGMPLLLQRGFGWLPAIAETVAKRFRLAGKGALAVGNDADFMVVVRQAHIIRREELRTRHPISPYVGMTSEMTVASTFQRGLKINSETAGRFIRSLPQRGDA